MLRLSVNIIAFEPGYIGPDSPDNGPDHTVGHASVFVTIDPTDDTRPGGWKSQEADIEEQVTKALNDVLVALSKAREAS